eukprot:Hpha_TRINITY_DN16085_c1_g9::TRINITY_DN16085_c1_g9_i1::g.118895::m.118895
MCIVWRLLLGGNKSHETLYIEYCSVLVLTGGAHHLHATFLGFGVARRKPETVEVAPVGVTLRGFEVPLGENRGHQHYELHLGEVRPDAVPRPVAEGHVRTPQLAVPLHTQLSVLRRGLVPLLPPGPELLGLLPVPRVVRETVEGDHALCLLRNGYCATLEVVGANLPRHDGARRVPSASLVEAPNGVLQSHVVAEGQGTVLTLQYSLDLLPDLLHALWVGRNSVEGVRHSAGDGVESSEEQLDEVRSHILHQELGVDGTLVLLLVRLQHQLQKVRLLLRTPRPQALFHDLHNELVGDVPVLPHVPVVLVVRLVVGIQHRVRERECAPREFVGEPHEGLDTGMSRGPALDGAERRTEHRPSS